MAKLIVIAIAIWLVITILKRYRNGVDQSGKQGANGQSPAETMIQCAHCGVHLPVSESIQSHGQFFCCQAHVNAPKDEPSN
jgi:uncharacterized protein